MLGRPPVPDDDGVRPAAFLGRDHRIGEVGWPSKPAEPQAWREALARRARVKDVRRLPRLWPTAGVAPRAANPGDGTAPGLWPRLWHITGVGPGRVTPAMCHHRDNTGTCPPEPGRPATTRTGHHAHRPPRDLLPLPPPLSNSPSNARNGPAIGLGAAMGLGLARQPGRADGAAVSGVAEGGNGVVRSAGAGSALGARGARSLRWPTAGGVSLGADPQKERRAPASAIAARHQRHRAAAGSGQPWPWHSARSCALYSRMSAICSTRARVMPVRCSTARG